ncbi:MAG: glycosyltransferase family 4 protein [Mucilaginibacter sp.]
MAKKIILFTLQTFSSTGGIQKMTRTLAHALSTAAVNNGWDFKLWSAYDKAGDLDLRYLPQKNFKGFGSRLKFIKKAMLSAVKFDVVILSHINLALAGSIIKLINPKCKIWLVAHGIEVWRKLSFVKINLLKNCDKIICVSNFTKNEIVKRHGIIANKCVVLNNVVDPFMSLPAAFEKPAHLLNKYGLSANVPILFTLTRLSAAEQYKGYEQVIKAVSKLKHTFPAITYIIAGAADTREEARVKKLIHDNNVDKHVILSGFINETELTDYFLLADVFVLPSRNEGFGIVFIEAMACGLPVICGNIDGSLDAIKNGELGTSVNPDNLYELENAITQCLLKPLTLPARKKLQHNCLAYFNEADYIKNLQQLLNNEFAH